MKINRKTKLQIISTTVIRTVYNTRFREVINESLIYLLALISLRNLLFQVQETD